PGQYRREVGGRGWKRRCHARRVWGYREEAGGDVVAADVDGDERNLTGVRREKRFRLAELTAGRVRASSAGHHRRRGFAAARQVDQLEAWRHLLLEREDVVDVATPARRSHTARQRVAEREIVGGRRRRHRPEGGSHDHAQDRGKEHVSCAFEHLSPPGEYPRTGARESIRKFRPRMVE